MQVDYGKNNTNVSNGPIRTNCLPIEELKKLASKSRIQMNYIISNIMVDTSKFSQPYIENDDSFNVNSDTNSWSRLVINMKQIDINTDVGFFYKLLRLKSVLGLNQ